MKPEIIDSYKPLTDEDLNSLEKQIGIKFPISYRKFLRQHNGGRFALPVQFSMIENRKSGVPLFLEFLSVQRKDGRWVGCGEPSYTKPKSWTSLLWTIGQDVFGASFCIAHDKKHRGKIYFVDSTVDYSVYLVANSLGEFLDSFRVSDDYQPVEPEGPLRMTETGDVTGLAASLAAGASIEMCNSSGQTLLAVASRSGQPKVVGELITRGASLEAGDQSGDTPLTHAVRNDWVDCTRLLLEAGANPNAESSRKQRVLFDAVRRYDRTALLLIEAGADVNSPNAKGETPLSACVWCWQTGGPSTFDVLRAYGAEPDAAIKSLNALIRSDDPEAYEDGCHDVRPHALEMLALLNAKEALLKLLRDGYSAAARKLLDITPESSDEVAMELRRLLSTSEGEDVRYACAAILKRCAPTTENRQALLEALNDSSGNVREAAEASLDAYDNSE